MLRDSKASLMLGRMSMPKEKRMSQRTRRSGLDDGTAEDFIKFLKNEAKIPKVVLDRDGIERQAKAWSLEWRARGLRPLQDVKEIFDEPQRVARLGIEGGLQTRHVVLFDKACNEFLEVRVRGVKLLNRLSMAGTGWVIVNRAAEDWARENLSGRVVRANGSIEPCP
jgi:hypothetical protein